MYQHAVLRLVLSSAFYTLVAVGTLVLVARSFLSTGAAGLLFLEAGVVLWSLAGTVGDLVFRGDANVDITIFNVGILLAALCHLCGAVLTTKPLHPLGSRPQWLALTITLALGALGLVTWAALTGRLPIFFIQGEGGTPVRYGVLIAAIAMFLLSALRLRAGGRAGMRFVAWYSLALLAMSVGLFGIMIQTSLGGIVNWLSRAAQWLGGVYLLAAAISSVRGTGAWSLPPDVVELDQPVSIWDDRVFRAFAPSRLWSLPPAWRYGMAVVIVAAATAVRWALLPWMGITAAYNIAFAANLVTTLLFGIGPGLLSVPLADLGVELFVVRSVPGPLTVETALRLAIAGALGVAIVGVFHAIRAAQVASRRDEARFSAFAAATFEGIAESEAGLIVDCNDQFAQMAGRTPSELKGIALTDLIPPEERDRATALLRENRDAVAEYSVLRRDGVPMTVEARGRPSAPNSPRRYTAVRDVTARKEMESERARSAERHQLALDAARMGWWHYDPITRVVTWDDRFKQIFGASEYTRPIDDVFAQMIHPDDLPGLSAAVEAALNPAAPQPYATEYRINRPEGATRWVDAHGLASFEGEGPQRHATSFVGTVADITDRKRAEESLRRLNADLEQRVAERTADLVAAGEEIQAERQRFLDVLDTLPVIVDIIGPDHRIEWANRAYREALGENQGRLCFASQFGRDEPCEECEAFTPLQTGRPHNWQWTLPDGRAFDVYNFPFADGDGSPMILEMDIDVTERRQAEETIRRAGAYNRSLIEASVDPLVTIGPDGRITDVNAATETVTGLPRDALVGTDFSDYFSEPEKARAGYQQAFREGIVRDYPLEIRSRDGRLMSVLYNATVYRDQAGQVTGVFAAARDLTERLRSERALAERTALVERQADQLRALATELAQAEQRERQRLAKILHDNIQQLLVAAQIQLNLIAREDHKTRPSALRGMEGILAETLEASRSLTVELCPPVLHQSGLAAALAWLAARLDEKQQFKVHLRLDNDAEPASPDERAFLFESTREMLLNAAKYSGTRDAYVTMMRTADDSCRIIVEDKGQGFDPAVLKPGPSGGFGLFSIQQRLICMGGTMEIESAPGQGTRGVLTIPIHREAAPGGAPASVSPDSIAARMSVRPKARTIRLLLADDHKMMRQGLSSLLQFENDIDIVAEAEDGEQALEAARQHKPDVVIMDVDMPVMNGIDATRILMDEMPGTKVIALSMHPDQDAAGAMREAGAVACLTKGGPSEDLVAAIRACASVTTRTPPKP